MAAVERALEAAAVFGHGEAESEIDHCQQDIHLGAEALPVRVGDGGEAGFQQVEDADDQHQRGVLEEADEGVDQRRDDQFQRLGQHDQKCLLPVRQAKRVGGLALPLGERLQAGADHFGEVGGGEQNDRDLRAQQLVDVDAFRQEQREQHAGHEQQADQRHAAD
jgi:hypothetical protein